jgi:hypothetical protein
MLQYARLVNSLRALEDCGSLWTGGKRRKPDGKFGLHLSSFYGGSRGVESFSTQFGVVPDSPRHHTVRAESPSRSYGCPGWTELFCISAANILPAAASFSALPLSLHLRDTFPPAPAILRRVCLLNESPSGLVPLPSPLEMGHVTHHGVNYGPGPAPDQPARFLLRWNSRLSYKSHCNAVPLSPVCLLPTTFTP